jgi:hypothetical protein
MSTILQAFRSRWGFHPCDYSTYRKLKFLNLVYLEAVRKAHAWQRWQRKDPHNRVIRRRIRNAQGQTVGYEPPVPLPEPPLCSMFCRKTVTRRHVDKKGRHYKEGFLEECVVLEGVEVALDYAACRVPAPAAAAVVPLRLTPTAIDALHERARGWVERQDVG